VELKNNGGVVATKEVDPVTNTKTAWGKIASTS
jgi:hypothetical protein